MQLFDDRQRLERVGGGVGIGFRWRSWKIQQKKKWRVTVTMPKKKHFGYVSGKKYDGMMGRCYREKDPSFKHYGAKGVAVCSAWIKDINSFRDWLLEEIRRIGISVDEFIERSEKLYLDRINPSGHYAPVNCRLASRQQSSRNQRRMLTKIVTSAEGEQIEIKGGLSA